MFDPDQFHDPEFRTLVLAARAVIAERVHRGVATPPKRLAVAALDEMPDEDDPAAVRAWAPSAAFRDAVRSVVLATLELYVGIVEVLADEADREDGDGMVVPPDVRNAGRVHTNPLSRPADGSREPWHQARQRARAAALWKGSPTRFVRKYTVRTPLRHPDRPDLTLAGCRLARATPPAGLPVLRPIPSSTRAAAITPAEPVGARRPLAAFPVFRAGRLPHQARETVENGLRLGAVGNLISTTVLRARLEPSGAHEAGPRAVKTPREPFRTARELPPRGLGPGQRPSGVRSEIRWRRPRRTPSDRPSRERFPDDQAVGRAGGRSSAPR